MKVLLLIGLLFVTTFCACIWVSRTLEKSQIAQAIAVNRPYLEEIAR